MASPEYTMSSSDFQMRHIPSLVAICMLFCDYMWTCRFEFTYIWKRPITICKIVFVIARYFEIITMVAHYCLVHLALGRSRHGIPPQFCLIWYTFLLVQCFAMSMALDAILVLRAAYALYQRNPIIFVLALPLSVPFILGFYLTWIMGRNAEESFDGVCSAYFLGTAFKIGIALGVSFLLSHVLLWLCVYIKRNVGQGHVPVVRLVVNEGGWVFIILFGLVAAIIPMDMALSVINPFIQFVGSSVLLSIVTCRIIRNMHHLAIDSASNTTSHVTIREDDVFRFTTIIVTDIGRDDYVT